MPGRSNAISNNNGFKIGGKKQAAIAWITGG
jgi:hypothetical protein